MTNLNLLDTFNRAMLEFRMTKPPPGELVCRMNRATLDKLKMELVGCGFAVIPAPADIVNQTPPGTEGIFCGALMIIDDSQADGVFALSVQMPVMRITHQCNLRDVI